MSSHTKVLKPAGQSADELEMTIAGMLVDLEQNNEMKADLRGLQIVAAKEVLGKSLYLYFCLYLAVVYKHTTKQTL